MIARLLLPSNFFFNGAKGERNVSNDLLGREPVIQCFPVHPGLRQAQAPKYYGSSIFRAFRPFIPVPTGLFLVE